jgi:hypothetical protein
MADLPDIHCWVKVLDPQDKVVPEGGIIQTPGTALVRYIVANDSGKPTGPITVVGALFRNGVKVQPGGQANVVPAQTITVQPNQVWKKEYTINEQENFVTYVGKILGDVGNFIDEEDEANNKGQRSFQFAKPF